MAFKDSMKIMINALSVKGGGGLTYLLELTKELAKICNSYKIYILVAKYNRKFFKVNLPREVTIIETPVSTLTVRLFYEQVILPLVISREKIDLLYCPAEILSFFAPCLKVLGIQNSKVYYKIPIRRSF